MSEKAEQAGAPLRPEVMSVLNVLPQTWYLVDVLGTVHQSCPNPGDFGLVVLDQIQNQEVVELIENCRQSETSITREIVLPRTRTHAEQTLRLRLSPLNGTYVLLLVEDLTEERRLDAVRRDFVANISHELKTPVGAISLLAEAVDAAYDDKEALQNFTARIKREADRLATLVKDLIDLSHVQDNQRSLERDDVDVDELVTAALDAVQTLAAANGIELVVGGTGQLHLPGNFDQLGSALRNLLTNAVHYSAPGTRVAVGTARVGDFIEISVVDQGIGIPRSDQDRIFERFYRVDAARSRTTGGTGLGLAIVKHVCASHGGECVVWSNPGDGSTFTLRLPAYPDGSGEQHA